MEEGSGEFLVRFHYAVFSKERAEYTIWPHGRQVDIPHKHIWDTLIPFSVAFFARRAYFGRIQTIDKLVSKGMNLADGCILCHNGGEIASISLLPAP